jgi:F0F1-type ATP synthase delta subunit
MSANPLAIASPYARALFDFQLKKHNASNYSRFSNLKFFRWNFWINEYLNNPVVNQNAKREVYLRQNLG